MIQWFKKNHFAIFVTVGIVFLIIVGILGWLYSIGVSHNGSIEGCAEGMRTVRSGSRQEQNIQESFQEMKNIIGIDVSFNVLRNNDCFPFAGFGDYQDIYVFEVTDEEMQKLLDKLYPISIMDDTAGQWTYKNCTYTFERINHDDKWSFFLRNRGDSKYPLCTTSPEGDGYADLSSFEIEVSPLTHIVGIEQFFE